MILVYLKIKFKPEFIMDKNKKKQKIMDHRFFSTICFVSPPE